MPFPKKIDPPDDHDAILDAITDALRLPVAADMGTSLRATPPVAKAGAQDMPRVGEFYADYSAITPQEIAETDADCEELFKNSVRVSR